MSGIKDIWDYFQSTGKDFTWYYSGGPRTEICPICKGAGKLVKDLVPGMPFKQEDPCYGCEGKGWIKL